MPTRFSPLKLPNLFPGNGRRDVELSLQATYDDSNHTLNDVAPGSVLRVFAEMMNFAKEELLFYVNKLPLAIVLQFLQIIGIQRRLGSPAVATLQVTLAAPLSEAWILPQGFAVRGGGYKFKIDLQIVIPAGSTLANVTATCTTLGSGANLPKLSINSPLQSLPGLSAITNLEPAAGGTDSESIRDVMVRAFRVIRRRAIVTQRDFEDKTREILGSGSVARAVENLALNQQSREVGAAHVFALNPDGTALNRAQRAALQTQLQSQAQMGIVVHVSSVDIVDLSLIVIARTIAGTNPRAVADAINARLRKFLRPGELPLGRAILVDDLRYQVRLAQVQFVESVTLIEPGDRGGYTSNRRLPYRWSSARLQTLTVTLSDGRFTFEYVYE
jgi:hypothetical protein